ncbi:MAG: putative acyltransferase [Tardiphaga sp.]|nr:putative acyltransferase [Tardiphaga sp.]
MNVAKWGIMKKLTIIQGLRAVAANLVVVSHLSVIELTYGHGYVVLPDAEVLGRLGVLLFFMISGFVMAMVASRSTDWRQFLWARITRIYPVYWLYTALVLAAAMVAPAMLAPDIAVQPSVLRSFLLIPDQTLPVLQVGWSLIYEIYFYLVISFFLAFRINLVAGLLGWSLILLLPIPATAPALAVAFDPIAFNFIGGALFWIGLSRLRTEIPEVTLELLERLGDASYSTYLSHVLLLSALGALFAALPWHSWAAESAFLMVCMVAANGWGWLSYHYIERPLIELSRRMANRETAPLPHERSFG